MKKHLLLVVLPLSLGFSSLKAQKGLWAGAELITDHKGNTGINYFGGYFRKRDQTLYLAPYLQAGYMPKMSFDDSASFKYISMEAGMSAVLQFDVFKAKLSVAPVQYIPLNLGNVISSSKTLFIPSLSVGTGQSILGIVDINLYYGHSVNFSTSDGLKVSFKLSDPYTKVGLNVGLVF
jgi:hypothetical protein